MQQIKRERRRNSIDDDDDDGAKKLKVESNSSSIPSITNFEDLANEMICEIFELLDFDDLYEAFSNLNIRFQNLLADSHCSIRFSLSLVSKSTFQRYYTEFIQPNQHRIKSLYLPNTFMINPILTPICNTSKLLRLETLTVSNIFSKHLDELFQCLSTLPVLSALTIFPLDYVKDKSKVYCQILGLSKLKYCKIQLGKCNISKALSITSNTSSSIEYLVIRNNLHVNTLMALLSYIPHLRHLSVHSLCRPNNEQIDSCSITFNQLIYIDLHVVNIVFDDFVVLIRKLSPRVDTLRLSTGNDITYLDGKKWEELILSDMPYLRIFDLHVFYCQPSSVFYHGNIAKWKCLFRTFQSSFYFDRKWFFAYVTFGENSIFFYSTDPYRRKQYELYAKAEEKSSSTCRTTRIDSVKSVMAVDEETILNCSSYFPNAIELEIGSLNSRYAEWDQLNPILPLQQLITVVFSVSVRNLEILTGLLNLTPNLHTLMIICPGILDAREEYVLSEHNQTFELVSNANHIKILIISICLTLKEIKLFTDLCPRVEHLTICIHQNLLRRALQFLLSKKNTKTRHLNSLFIDRTSEIPNEIIESIIESGDFQVDYIIGKDKDEHLRNIYLWL